MKLVLDGMAEGFMVTDGLGDPSAEPPPTVPDVVEDTVLGDRIVDLGSVNQNPTAEDEGE